MSDRHSGYSPDLDRGALEMRFLKLSELLLRQTAEFEANYTGGGMLAALGRGVKKKLSGVDATREVLRRAISPALQEFCKLLTQYHSKPMQKSWQEALANTPKTKMRDLLESLIAEEAAQARAIVLAARDQTKNPPINEKQEYLRTGIITVPNAKNPYREALLAAGLPEGTTETAEEQETLVNIPEEIERQTAVYAACKDKDGKFVLTDWVKDITERQDLLYAEVAKDYAKIVERIKAGMVPTVMPSRSVQEAAWQATMTNLKPIWIDSAKPKPETEVNDSFLYDKFAAEKMNQAGFFKDIPDRPYLVWTKPSQKPDQETCDKTFDEQVECQKQLVAKYPNLYDPKDVIPTEYSAVLSNASRAVLERYKKIKGGSEEPPALKPLDYGVFTRFLSAGPFSGGLVPIAFFDPGSDYRRVIFGCAESSADGRDGFRPAARS